MPLLHISSTERQGMQVPRDDRFLDIGRLVVCVAADKERTSLNVCSEGETHLLTRYDDGFLYTWPPTDEDEYDHPSIAQNNVQAILQTGQGPSPDTGLVYLFKGYGEQVSDFLDASGRPIEPLADTLVLPTNYRGFGIVTVQEKGRLALHELVVSLPLSGAVLDALQRGVRAEVF